MKETLGVYIHRGLIGERQVVIISQKESSMVGEVNKLWGFLDASHFREGERERDDWYYFTLVFYF